MGGHKSSEGEFGYGLLLFCCLTEVAAVVSTENNSEINKTMPAKCKLNFFSLIDDICEKKKVYTWSQT